MTSNQRNAFLVAELRRLAKHYGGICQATLDEAADLLAEPGAPASTAVETSAEHVCFRAAGWLAAPEGETRESTTSLIQNLVARIGECERALRWMCPNNAYFAKHASTETSDECPKCRGTGSQ